MIVGWLGPKRKERLFFFGESGGKRKQEQTLERVAFAVKSFATTTTYTIYQWHLFTTNNK